MSQNVQNGFEDMFPCSSTEMSCSINDFQLRGPRIVKRTSAEDAAKASKVLKAVLCPGNPGPQTNCYMLVRSKTLVVRVKTRTEGPNSEPLGSWKRSWTVVWGTG